ncbi:hypothetical protein Pcinc_041045 [Petrolisthes cinctipes]|uniref:ER membrane protein complex subunit 1 n=1 Tax=Petrolisthes cinctipes TaxID=88211 RepID=A0AAE1BKX7_PETCI|nr:hypothetical protein Pcinc_041045 [Petrolisthes cinctipes]
MAAGLKAPLSLLLLLFLSHISPSVGLYEDQIGKFDWVQQYVGIVTHSVFDESTVPRRIVVATSENVLAALATKNGDIVWRQVLESGENGRVEALVGEGQRVTSVAGRMVRTWDTLTAALVHETYLTHTPHPGLLERAVVVGESELVLGEVVAGSVVVTTLDRVSGSPLDHTNVVAPWISTDTKCGSAGKSLVCVELSLSLIFVLLLTAPSPEFVSQPLASVGLEAPEPGSQVLLQNVPGAPDHLIIQVGPGRRLVHLDGNSLHLVRDLGGSQTSAVAGGVLYSLTQVAHVVTLGAVDLETGAEVGEQGLVVELPTHTGQAISLYVHHYQTSDGGSALRALLTCSDHSLHLLSSAGVVWWREEAMARVVSVEGVDLPVDGANINFQDPLPASPDWVSSLVHRVRTQVSQVSHWVSLVMERSDSTFPAPLHTLYRDQLNLRKLLVLATASGKIMGVDSWTGEVVWRIYVSELTPLEGDKLLLYTQRTSAHFPHQPQCVVVGKHRETGEGVLVAFNPNTGEGVGDRGGVMTLGYTIIQALLLHHPDHQYLKPVVLVDDTMKLHVFPAGGESVVLQHKDSIFVHLARPGSTHLTGYTLRFSTPGNLVLREVWRVCVGGGGIVTGVYGKLAWEKVHSPGRVLADRSVLYKYVNPNLAVVTTQGYDHLNKNTLTLYLVDTVSGAVIESVNHKKVSGPIHVVHSENWVVYTFFNDKYRRFEVTSLELFEGLSQANATAFSSLGGRATPPIMERQAYILPVGIQAATHTTTEKGITTKFILFALQTGNVMQMSKWLLDPRRPVTGGPREEGLLPYIPELRLSPHDMITYNHTLPRVSSIFTAPTGLESACVVLVYGLDLFYTRMFPSKMFDVLKDDFDHYLIGGVVLALMAAALTTRKLAQRKALKQAWK